MFDIFNISVPSYDNCIAIGPENLKRTCIESPFWDATFQSYVSQNFATLSYDNLKDVRIEGRHRHNTEPPQLIGSPASMHEALPDVSTMHIIDWKVHADTTTPEICTYIKEFLANDVSGKCLHIDNISTGYNFINSRVKIRKPLWTPEFYEIILDIVNGPVVGPAKLDFVYRCVNSTYHAKIKKEFFGVLQDINIDSYHTIALGFNNEIESVSYIGIEVH